MGPLIRAPSQEIAAAARALVDDPAHPPTTRDRDLARALRRVIDGLDAFERRSLERATRAPEGTRSRLVLEALLARRISLEITSIRVSGDDPPSGR